MGIGHASRGEEVFELESPTGMAYRLKNADPGTADDVHATYTVGACAQPADGTWTLRMRDMQSPDTGRLESWRLAV